MLMERLIDWYWEEGYKRTGRWIISSEWLDSVMKIVESDKNINSFMKLHPAEQKACFAIWGQSQAGKSTLLSHYLDGESPDGADSALTWTSEKKVIFSANGHTPNTTVGFNPYNVGSDASGVATRFFRPLNDQVQNTNFPAEISFASQKQILLALAMGYFGECEHPTLVHDLVSIQNLINELPTSNGVPCRKAFELLRDVCDICEIMSKEYDRFAVFKSHAKNSVRKEILSAKSLNSNIENAKTFASMLLWDATKEDSSNKLTILFNKINALQNKLSAKSADKKVLSSMILAAKLEDIDSIAHHPPTIYAADDDTGFIFLDIMPFSGATVWVDSGEFGYFQALIKELRIPIKASQKKNAFTDFLAKCDLLDFPGVTNVAVGAAAANKIDLSSPNTTAEFLLSKLYKTGKTLSIIYSQVETLSIDAFCILINLSNALTQPATISNGIKTWVNSFEHREWDCKSQIQLKLYLNLSCFGLSLLKSAAGTKTGLAPWVAKVQGIPFANANVCKIFFTNNRFNAFSVTDADVQSAKQMICEDRHFRDAFLSTENSIDSFNALFIDALGTNHMFDTIGKEISCKKRKSIFEKQHVENIEKIHILINSCLPRKGVIDYQALCTKITNSIDELIDPDDFKSREVSELEALLKDLLHVEPSSLESLPTTKGRASLTQDVICQYLDNQIGMWMSAQKEHINTSQIERLLMGGSPIDLDMFLRLISSIDSADIAEFVKNNFNYIKSAAQATRAKTLLAMLLNNLLLSGSIQKPGDTMAMYPITYSFKERIDSLNNNVPNNDNRPTQPGDVSLEILRTQL